MSKLYRSRTDRFITGLSGGLGETFGIDSTWVRLLLVVTAFFSGGVVIPLYFLAVLVIPKEPRNERQYGFDGGSGWNGPNPGAEYSAPWGSEWGKHWGGKKYGCGHRKHRRDERHAHEAQYEQNNTGYQNQQSSGSNLDDMMKDIEKKAMWKEIEELRAKVAQYERSQQNEKNQQTKGEV